MMADMGRSDDPQALLKTLAQGARRVLGAPYSAVMTTAETPGVVEIRAVSGVPLQYLPMVEKVWGRLMVGTRLTLSPQGSGPLSLAFFQKRDIFITEWPADLAAFPGANLIWRTMSETLNVRALWCLPLTLSPADESLGLIVLGRTENQPPPSDDRDFAMAFVAQAALAVKSARLYESEHVRRREETQQRTLAEAQQQMAVTVGATLELSDVAPRVLTVVVKFIPCDSAVLHLRYGDLLRGVAAHQSSPEVIGEEIDLTAPLLEEMIHRRQPIWLPDAQADPRCAPLRLSAEVRGWIAAPLMVSERLIGMMSLGSSSEGRFGPAEAELLHLLGRQAVPALDNALLYGEATRRLQHMAILNELSAAAASAAEFDEVAQRVVLTLKRVLQCDIVNLRMLDPSGVLFVVHPANVGAELGWRGRPLGWGEGVVGQAAVLGQPIRVNDVRRYPGYVMGWVDARSELCAPIRSGQRVIGVISAQSNRLAAFSDDDVHLLSIVAGQLAVAVEAEHLREVERERAAYLGVLYQMSQSIAATLDPDEVLQVAVVEIVARFAYALAAILIVDESRGEYELRAIAGSQIEQIPPDLRQSVNTGIIGHVYQSGQTYVTNSVSTDPYYYRAHERDIGAELAVPLKRQGRVIGVLNLERPSGERFRDAEIMAMETLAGQVATALDNAHLYARSRQTVRELSDSLAQLRLAQAQLIQSAKLAAIGQLAAGVAHEVNNPLQSIQNCLHLASRPELSEEKRRTYHRMAEEEVERLIQTVRQMLDFYRLSSADFVPTDVNALLDEVLGLAETPLADSHVQIKKLYRRSLPPVPVARNNLKQVFLNLILNARDAMPGGGSLELRTGLSRKGGNRVAEISFTDSGPGIAADELPRLFEPFYTTKERGIGLGLAVSYSIVEAHGGSISVDSTPNVGTTFRVLLPMEQGLSANEQNDSPAPNSGR